MKQVDRKSKITHNPVMTLRIITHQSVWVFSFFYKNEKYLNDILLFEMQKYFSVKNNC